MNILIMTILLLNICFSQNISAQEFNLQANYLNVDGEKLVFKPSEKSNKDVVVYFDHLGLSIDIEEIDGFTKLSYFYIPLKSLQHPSAWRVSEYETLELTKITHNVDSDVYYHFVFTDTSVTEFPFVSYIYSESKGVIIFELLTDHPDEFYHKSYVLIDETGIGKVLINK